MDGVLAAEGEENGALPDQSGVEFGQLRQHTQAQLRTPVRHRDGADIQLIHTYIGTVNI